jgi:hypothetical protein
LEFLFPFTIKKASKKQHGKGWMKSTHHHIPPEPASRKESPSAGFLGGYILYLRIFGVTRGKYKNYFIPNNSFTTTTTTVLLEGRILR